MDVAKGVSVDVVVTAVRHLVERLLVMNSNGSPWASLQRCPADRDTELLVRNRRLEVAHAFVSGLLPVPVPLVPGLVHGLYSCPVHPLVSRSCNPVQGPCVYPHYL